MRQHRIRFTVVAGRLSGGAIIEFQREVHQDGAIALYRFRHAGLLLYFEDFCRMRPTISQQSVGRIRCVSIASGRVYYCFFALEGKKPSSTISAAPTQMAVSARLKVAKCQSPTCVSIASGRVYYCFFALEGKKPSSTISAAPTQMAVSARLKVAKCQSPT